MADYERDVVRILKRAGCRRVRQGQGDHEVWYSPVNARTFTVKAHGMRSSPTPTSTVSSYRRRRWIAGETWHPDQTGRARSAVKRRCASCLAGPENSPSPAVRAASSSSSPSSRARAPLSSDWMFAIRSIEKVRRAPCLRPRRQRHIVVVGVAEPGHDVATPSGNSHSRFRFDHASTRKPVPHSILQGPLRGRPYAPCSMPDCDPVQPPPTAHPWTAPPSSCIHNSPSAKSAR
ncbi:MAG: type II toxin-antitoxin system HicA family toxin [Pseudomonadales bacterium]|nr:type II toxin-antitoxin system HicA family toxin [Pseudomonadales bacterium]